MLHVWTRLMHTRVYCYVTYIEHISNFFVDPGRRTVVPDPPGASEAPRGFGSGEELGPPKSQMC